MVTRSFLKMYHKSFADLQVDYIDYMLLHGIGMGGMDALKGRYLDNGMLDFLIKNVKQVASAISDSPIMATSKYMIICFPDTMR